MAKKKRTDNPHRRTRRSARRRALCICESIFHGLYIGLDSACGVLAHILLRNEISQRHHESARETYSLNRYGRHNQKNNHLYFGEDEDNDKNKDYY